VSPLSLQFRRGRELRLVPWLRFSRVAALTAVRGSAQKRHSPPPPPPGCIYWTPCGTAGEVAFCGPAPRRAAVPQKQRPAHPGRQKQRPSHPGRLKTAPSVPWPAKNSAQRTLAAEKMPATAGSRPDLVGPVEEVASPAPRAPKTAPSAPWPAKTSAARHCLGACV
jgi:hypothetical protein